MRGPDDWRWPQAGQTKRQWRVECIRRQWERHHTLYSHIAMEKLLDNIMGDLEAEFGPMPERPYVNPETDLNIDAGWPYTFDHYRNRREDPKHLGPYKRR